MNISLKTYLEKNIPFALFRAPGQRVRLVAQLSPFSSNNNLTDSGFHFAPFSRREKVPHVVIKNEVDECLDLNEFKESKLKYNTGFAESKSDDDNVVSSSTYAKHLQTYFSFFEKNNIRKAIYSRIKKTELPKDFDLISFFRKIENAYPKAFVYIVHLPNIGLWAGASPERLLEYNNGIAKTVALAGTQKMQEGIPAENLDWGQKEIEEHQMVAEYISNQIKKNDLTLIDKSKPYTSAAGRMAHLKQNFEFQIKKEELNIFLNDLHPTPAVCGLPKEKALDLIYNTEPYDREYYAGYLGMVEKNSTVNFYVNLRCMKIYNNTASLFVGGGITASSVPEKEWEETELKAKTLLNILDLIEV